LPKDYEDKIVTGSPAADGKFAEDLFQFLELAFTQYYRLYASPYRKPGPPDPMNRTGWTPEAALPKATKNDSSPQQPEKKGKQKAAKGQSKEDRLAHLAATTKALEQVQQKYRAVHTEGTPRVTQMELWRVKPADPLAEDTEEIEAESSLQEEPD